MSLTPEFLQICQSATTTPDGALHIVGITDTFRSPTYPSEVEPMAILFRFRLPALSKVTGKLRFALMDPEEKVVWKNSGTIDLLSQPTSQEHETAVSNMIFAFNRFRFATAGTYQLAAYWDEAQGRVGAAVPSLSFRTRRSTR